MQIEHVMTPGLEFIDPNASIQDAACKMRDLNIGCLTVIDDGDLVGMITDRDICCRVVGEGLNAATTRVREAMSENVTYCFEDQDIVEAARLMEARHIRRLAVLNRAKQAVGFVSIDDLARYSHNLAGEVLEAATGVV